MIWSTKIKLNQFPVTPLRCTRPAPPPAPIKQASALFFQLLPWSLSTFFRILQDFFFIIPLQFLLGPPLLRFPWGLQLKTHSSAAKESFLSGCPIHFHFPALSCIATGSPRTPSCCSSMGKTWELRCQFFVRHLFVNQAVENYSEVNQETVQSLRMRNINVFIAG